MISNQREFEKIGLDPSLVRCILYTVHPGLVSVTLAQLMVDNLLKLVYYVAKYKEINRVSYSQGSGEGPESTCR